MLEDRLSGALTRYQQQALWRQQRTVQTAQQVQLCCDGQAVINFASSDYLSLANHPKIKEAFKKGVDNYGFGSGASQSVCGFSTPYEQLQQALASWLNYERILLFSSGYLANLAVLSTLLNVDDVVLHDRLNHASLIDGTKLSGARLRRFSHVNPAHLQQRLLTMESPCALVVTEGVFSMEGDVAPLPALADICCTQKIPLMVDDAHGIGVLGATGAGTVEEHHLSANEVPILMATFSKALGGMGAFVAANATIIDSLQQFARSYMFTTALPPAVMVANLAAVKLAQQTESRLHLQALIDYYQQVAQQLNLPILKSYTPIQPLIFHDTVRAVKIADALFNKGFLVGLMRPPSVPKNTARLRIVLTAAHQRSHIDQLLEACQHVIKEI